MAAEARPTSATLAIATSVWQMDSIAPSCLPVSVPVTFLFAFAFALALALALALAFAFPLPFPVPFASEGSSLSSTPAISTASLITWPPRSSVCVPPRLPSARDSPGHTLAGPGWFL